MGSGGETGGLVRASIHYGRIDLRIRYLAGLAAFGLLAVAAPAFAATGSHTPPEVCGTWQMRGATGTYPAITFGGPPAGSGHTAHSASLVKPTEGTMPGVEFAAYNLDVTDVDGDTTVQVHFALSGGATTDAGAIRLFGYAAKNADTVHDGPTYGGAGDAIAAGSAGTLSFTIPAGEDLGTLGVTYDGSNLSAGKVTFENMTIGKRKVTFNACAAPSPSASATPTAAPTSPAATPTGGQAEPTDEPTGAPQATLPKTGPPTGAIAAGSAVILAIGVALVVLARRRRTVTALPE